MNNLTPRENRRYGELKKKIAASLWDAAEAAEEINKNRLYQNEYKTFDDFLSAECGYSRQRFHQLIKANSGRKRLESSDNVSSMLDKDSKIHPDKLSVRAAEEIGKADERDVQDIIDKSVEIANKTDSPLTAKIIKQASKEISCGTDDYNPDDYEDDCEPTGDIWADYEVTEKPTALDFAQWSNQTTRLLRGFDESYAESAHEVIYAIWPKKAAKSKNEAIEKPDDVTSGTWQDWLAARKAKKAGPVTLSVIKAVVRESEKAGICIDEALSRAAGRGWQTYRADWDDDLAKESVGARSMREKL